MLKLHMIYKIRELFIYEESNPKFVMAPFLRNHDQARVIDSFKDYFQMK